MKKFALVAGLMLGATTLASPPAHAIGCLSGAAVGAVGGHVAGHHAVLGAIAGCAVGHHQAVVNKRNAAARAAALQQQQQGQMSTDQGTMPSGSAPASTGYDPVTGKPAPLH